MSRLKCIDDLVKGFAARRPIRSGSLIISVFGDSISQHGNCVWLGSLIQALQPFGLNARQIRTAVFRLGREGWLSAEQSGRRSFYSLAETGIGRYARAARRIYAARRPDWDGTWTLVIPASLTAAARDALRRELLWLGYGPLVQGLLAHPAADRRSLEETLRERDLLDSVVVLEARSAGIASPGELGRMVHDCWGLDGIARRYGEFLDQFRLILSRVRRTKQLAPEQCFQARTLLIHEFRRILLHDTDLPDELLPRDWPGVEAFRLTRDLYREVQAGAVQFITRCMEGADGALPPAAPSYFSRFGGLDR